MQVIDVIALALIGMFVLYAWVEVALGRIDIEEFIKDIEKGSFL